jgi:hypothetical protein
LKRSWPPLAFKRNEFKTHSVLHSYSHCRYTCFNSICMWPEQRLCAAEFPTVGILVEFLNLLAGKTCEDTISWAKSHSYNQWTGSCSWYMSK